MTPKIQTRSKSGLDGTVANSRFVSEVNTRLIMQSVRTRQPIGRAAIARHTGLSPATVTTLVPKLLEMGLLRELDKPVLGPVRGRGGRPPRPLCVNTAAHKILALDLEPDCIRAALTDLVAEPLVSREQLIDRRSDANVICDAILSVSREVLHEHRGTQLRGIGLCLPGLINVESGIAISSTNMPHWQNVPIRDILESAFGAPVSMDRSMHLAAQHELWLDPALQNQRVVVLSLRTGIGMSLMDRGTLYMGRHGFAGEIGHTVIALDGPLCECGSRGCLETYVSASAILARARALLHDSRATALQEAVAGGETLRPALIYRLAHEGDAACGEVVRAVGHYIGIAAANLINLLAPDLLILSGSIEVADRLILDAVREQVDRRALPRFREDLRIRLASARERAPLLGAAVMVARQLFDLPRLRNVVPSET